MALADGDAATPRDVVVHSTWRGRGHRVTLAASESSPSAGDRPGAPHYPWGTRQAPSGQKQPSMWCSSHRLLTSRWEQVSIQGELLSRYTMFPGQLLAGREGVVSRPSAQH